MSGAPLVKNNELGITGGLKQTVTVGAGFKPALGRILQKRAGLRPAPSAPAGVFAQRGASPLQVYLLRPVTDCNCVVARRGGEQQEVNDQSVG